MVAHIPMNCATITGSKTRTGRRFWLYRAGLYRADAPARWFLHGVFA